jgi:glycosyltransferase involved in cell wall biosynthesis
MRVLQFGRFWGDNHGGVERHVHLLSKGLAAQGVDVVNLVASQDLKAHDEWVDGFRLVQAPSFGMAFRTAMSPELVWRALQLHREKPFDVFHFHFPDPLTHLASEFLPHRVKRVITWHSEIVRQKRALAVYKPFLQRVTRRADTIVAATTAHFDSSHLIPTDIPESRRRVIPYGMDFSAMELTERVEQLRSQIKDTTDGRSLVFALGRHVYYKGFDILIDAIHQMDAHLILGGDGPLRAVLERHATELGIAERVHFPGRIPESELPAYFHACDVFCLPSINEMEAFGLVQLEAMVCGKPVVCTQLNNGVNFVNVEGVTGLMVPVGDAKALSEALSTLLDNAFLRERLGQQARERALVTYSLQTMAVSHVKLYQDLLKTRR